MGLYYISFGTYKGFEQYCLKYSPAANQKSLYVIDLLDRLQTPYSVISMSRPGCNKHKWFPRKTEPCGIYGQYTVWGSVGRATKIHGGFQKLLRKAQLQHFLNGLTPHDTIIVYHSLSIDKTILEAKLHRGFTLILELEEIYQDAVSCSKAEALSENEIIDAADGFILSTPTLSDRIKSGKPYIIICGTYKPEPLIGSSFIDGKIHCVYAGTFDPAKGGASATVGAAEFLPENYHVHILGFGTKEQEKLLLQQIDDVKQRAVCDLTYNGLKSGEEYTRFLQKCQIGLCTQIPEGKYIETSFPSKILVYLANGMRVLSARIPAIVNSDVGDLLYYYEEQSSKSIAEAIQEINFKDEYDSREKLNALDRKVEEELCVLLRSINHEVVGQAEEQR